MPFLAYSAITDGEWDEIDDILGLQPSLDPVSLAYGPLTGDDALPDDQAAAAAAIRAPLTTGSDRKGDQLCYDPMYQTDTGFRRPAGMMSPGGLARTSSANSTTSREQNQLLENLVVSEWILKMANFVIWSGEGDKAVGALAMRKNTDRRPVQARSSRVPVVGSQV